MIGPAVLRGVMLLKYLGGREMSRPDDGGTELRSRARRGRREAPEPRAGVGSDEGRRSPSPPQYGGLGAMPPENFAKDQR